MQNSDDISGLVAALTGSHYYIFNYLMEEIIARQNTEVSHFLLYTSILNQMTPSLCDDLLKEDSGSISNRPSADILEEMVRANLFILPLDPERRWYRYHSLY